MKKRKKRIISCAHMLLVFVLLVSILGHTNVSSVSAATTRMYGVQQTINSLNEDNPFLILEVVPDDVYASFGYYVKDFEPQINAKLLADWVNTVAADDEDALVLSDTSFSQQTRVDKVIEYFSGIGAVEGSSDAASYPFTYGTGDFYTEQLYLSSSQDIANWNVIEAGDGTVFFEQRIGYYRPANNYGLEYGDYNIYFVSSDESESTNISEEQSINTVEEDATATTTPTPTPELEEVVVYNPGAGNYVWVDDATDGTTQLVQFDTLYYQTKVTSNEWFVKHILETTSNEFIKVISLTVSELDEKLKAGDLADGAFETDITLNEIDMIYFSNSSCLNLSGVTDAVKATFGTYANEGTALSWDSAYSIYEYVINTNLAVIMDDSILTDVTAAGTNNVYRLAYLLKDYTEETTLNTYGLSEDTTNDAWTSVETTLLTSVASKTVGTNGKVQACVYFNTIGNLVNTTLNTTNLYDSSTVAEADIENTIAGMGKIVEEITSENFYNDVNNAGFTTEYTKASDGTVSIQVKQSTLVKYILNYRYRRIMLYKDKITVLDIEPTKYSKLTEATIRGWLGSTEASQKIKEINIVQTTTSEFIGKLTDLNEEYDLIYFGSCIGNGSLQGSMNQSGGKTVYNDTSMNGLIYSHVGDLTHLKKTFLGLMNTEPETVEEAENTLYTTRYAGNDITKQKLADLKAFVDAGYPVVIANEFYTENTSTISTSYVDDSSYIYNFMSSYTGTKSVDNVMKEGNIVNTVMARYINMPKLYMSMISVPTEYAITYTDGDKDEIASVSYMDAVDGKYSLEYVFELTDTSDGSDDTKTCYQVKLYIDTNADGQYTDLEELDGLTVQNVETGASVAVNKLETQVRYKVTRELPEGYVGMLPWKLVVSTTTDSGTVSSVRTSTTGYTAIKSEGVTINVLQIGSNHDHNLNLATNATYQKLFNNLYKQMNYTINITHVKASEYTTAYSNFSPTDADKKIEEFYESYFASYDMLILGFADCYQEISSANATQAIKMFIESGRSVLFSHDTTSFVNMSNSSNFATYDQYWGYNLNTYIRSIVGMDRYGITESSLSVLKYNASLALTSTDSATASAIKTLNKDYAYTPNGGLKTTVAGVHGYSNYTLVANCPSYSTYSYKDYVYSDSYQYVEKVTQVNKGQITTYPYTLNIADTLTGNRTSVTSGGTTYQMQSLDKFTVSTTHGQYYQLDMQLDKTSDGESDIVVWYCLGDRMYDTVPNDVRNNYYIYSVGNVTYTGMGHFASSSASSNIALEEAKLFVNTIVASYNSGKRNPSISIIKDETNKSAELNYVYRIFDGDIGIQSDEDETLYFYVNDTNIINGTKKIYTTYYYEVSASASYDETFTDGNQKPIYLKAMTDEELASSVKTVGNNTVCGVTIDAEWLNDALGSSSSVKIYIGAYTELDYNANRKNETTEEVFASVEVKRRELFDLD